jgi:uncharacterized membrane protein YdjX (TVP38/TMEM64 family)
MPWPHLLIAAGLGALPEAILYAIAGSAAASFGNAALVFVAVVVLAVVAGTILARRGHRSPHGG